MASLPALACDLPANIRAKLGHTDPRGFSDPRCRRAGDAYKLARAATNFAADLSGAADASRAVNELPGTPGRYGI